MAKKRVVKKSNVNQNRLVQGAIQDGIEAILKKHPGFEGYINDHIDKKKLSSGLKRIEGHINREGHDWSEERKSEFIYNNLANYVASGGIFDDKAKEVILEKSLEERTVKGGKSKLEGEENIDMAGNAFKDLYNLMKSGDYAARMPDLAEAVTTMYDLGFMKNALKVLNSYGLLNKENKKAIYDRIEELEKDQERKIGDAYEKRLEPRHESEEGDNIRYMNRRKGKRAVALVFSLFGIILLIMFGNKVITGNVIGISGGDLLGSIFGLGFIFVSALLFWRRKK